MGFLAHPLAPWSSPAPVEPFTRRVSLASVWYLVRLPKPGVSSMNKMYLRTVSKIYPSKVKFWT